MIWKYALVFILSSLVDIVPFPLPPAFTVMIVLQIIFKLNVWVVIALGVTGSILGRYILILYIPKVSGRIFKKAKNEDVQFLGNKMKEKGWKGQLIVLIYSLLPLPTTPLFVAGGMARMTPLQMLPAFFIGKTISDTAAVLMGKYASENIDQLLNGLTSWQSIGGLTLGLIMIAALLFIDWRSLIQKKKLVLKFRIFSNRGKKT